MNWKKKLQKPKPSKLNWTKLPKSLRNSTNRDTDYFYSGKKLQKSFQEEINQ